MKFVAKNAALRTFVTVSVLTEVGNHQTTATRGSTTPFAISKPCLSKDRERPMNIWPR